MPFNTELKKFIKGFCGFPGENHPVIHPADSVDGEILSLDFKNGGVGYCDPHDTYSVTPAQPEPEVNTAS